MKADAFRFDGRTPCDLSKLPTDAGGEKGQKGRVRRKDRRQPAADGGFAGSPVRRWAGGPGHFAAGAGRRRQGRHHQARDGGGLNPQGVTVYKLQAARPGPSCSTTICGGWGQCLPPRGGHRHLQPQLLRGRAGGADARPAKRPTAWPTGLLEDDETVFSANATARSATLRNICTRTASGWSRSFCTCPKPSRKSGFWSASTRRKRTGSSRRRTLPSALALTSTTTCTARSSPKRASKHAPWYALPADQKWYTRYLVSEVVADALGTVRAGLPQGGRRRPRRDAESPAAVAWPRIEANAMPFAKLTKTPRHRKARNAAWHPSGSCR